MIKKESEMFIDRFDAGKQLAQQLQQYKNNPDVVILAIPRGALQIGYVLAQELHAPLDVLFSKKIGAPGHEEYAIGAVTLDNAIVDPAYNREYPEYINTEIQRIRQLLQQRMHHYYGDRKPTELNNKIVIITDDGVATGKTLLLALDLIKQQKPKKIIVVLPVAPEDAIKKIEKKADEVVCLARPITFFGIGQFYRNFEQVDDQEAIRLLREANA